MNKLNDKYLRQALSRREARRTRPEVPSDFCDSIMQEIAHEKAAPKHWRWMSAAAGLLIIIGIAATLWMTGGQEPTNSSMLTETEQPQPINPDTIVAKRQIAQTAEPEPKNTEANHGEANHGDRLRDSMRSLNHGPVPVIRQEPQRDAADSNLQYAAYTTEQDSNYQAPSRMDEFIAKMAEYNKVKGIALDCAPDRADSTVVSTVYVFEDKQEFALFARLLQAACWYDSKTPGYLLNFSHQQFFFTLKDLRKGEKYLWIADRLAGGRILLFSTHSPIEADVSSACYQNYREQLTHNNFSTLQL